MYKILGDKVDHLPEADLLDELRTLAMVKSSTEVQVEAHHAMENPAESTLTKENTIYKIINPFIAEQRHQNQPTLTKRSTADTTTRSHNEMHDTEDLTADESTPDWNENFSSLMLIRMKVPSESDITELNLSCSTTTMTTERWGRPTNMPRDMSKDHKLPMTVHDEPDEDSTTAVTEDTMDTMEPTQNRKSTGGLEQNPLPHKTNTALAPHEVQTETDEPIEDDEADLDINTPETDERDLTAAIKEVDRQSNGPSTIVDEVKNPTNQPRIIDVEEEENNPEEETDKIITGKFKKPTNKARIIDLESESSEDETDESAHTSDEWVEHDDALPTTPKTTPDDAVPSPPHERLYRSRYLVKVCGYHTHGIWCDCPFVPKPSPRYHVESNLTTTDTAHKTQEVCQDAADGVGEELWDTSRRGVHA
jgi:hypothetical protein